MADVSGFSGPRGVSITWMVPEEMSFDTLELFAPGAVEQVIYYRDATMRWEDDGGFVE